MSEGGPLDGDPLALRVIQTLVLYALAEHQQGHARRIDVSLADGQFAVSDDGRGHGVDRTVDGTPYLDLIYTHQDYPFGRADTPAVQLQGLGMSLLNGLCAELTVTVRKPAKTLQLRFEHGRLTGRQLSVGDNAETGTRVAGRLPARRVEANPQIQAAQPASPAQLPQAEPPAQRPAHTPAQTPVQTLQKLADWLTALQRVHPALQVQLNGAPVNARRPPSRPAAAP